MASAEAGTAAEIARREAEEEQGLERPISGRAGDLARAAREAREQGDDAVSVEEDDPSAEARQHAAQGNASESDWDEVTQWFLEERKVEVATRKLKVRVGGTDDEPKFLPWIIHAVPTDIIRQAEREATNRAGRRGGAGGAYDETKANLRVVVEGTLKPDLKAIAQQAGIADATFLLRDRFAFLPGVMARIAGEIMSLSGFDEQDVQAAGNS